MTDWEKLIERYAEGKTVCNCRQAYYKPCGEGLIVVSGQMVRKTDMLVCEHGCGATQINAREYVAKRVLADLDQK